MEKPNPKPESNITRVLRGLGRFAVEAFNTYKYYPCVPTASAYVVINDSFINRYDPTAQDARDLKTLNSESFDNARLIEAIDNNH